MIKSTSNLPRHFTMQNAAFAGLTVFLIWFLSKLIVEDNLGELLVLGAAIMFCAIALWIMGRWTRGLYVFLFCLVFEDFARKYLGNSTALFFAKDLVLGITYLSVLRTVYLKRFPTFRPYFRITIIAFLAWGIIQVFNTNSPSILYGLLGFKLYFFYLPLVFLGYAYLRSDADLEKFLTLNLWVVLVVGSLGIAQSIIGPTFLNPMTLAPELQELGALTRYSPVTHLALLRPTSVFVSDGRFAQYLTLMFLLVLGTIGMEVAKSQKARLLSLCAAGIVIVATIQSGSRSAFLYLIAFTIIALVWFRKMGVVGLGRQLRVGKVLRSVAVIATLAITMSALIFPDALKARWAFYTETLSPTSSASEFSYRAWDYPVANLEKVFAQPNWLWGNGIGTASLGAQYVSRFIGQTRPDFGSESGFGQLILELGIVGAILWSIWVIDILLLQRALYRKLRGTPYAPLAFCILLFGVYLVGSGSFYGITSYLNYFSNAYFWLLTGMAIRLPALIHRSRPTDSSQAEKKRGIAITARLTGSGTVPVRMCSDGYGQV